MISTFHIPPPVSGQGYAISIEYYSELFGKFSRKKNEKSLHIFSLIEKLDSAVPVLPNFLFFYLTDSELYSVDITQSLTAG